MGSLFFNFIKRAIIVPLLAAALVSGIVILAASNAVAASEINVSDGVSRKPLDITSYSTRDYKSFSQLKPGEFVGTVKCDAIGLSERAILFSESESSDIKMHKQSVEPWKNGGILIVGANTDEQLRAFHYAEKGDVVTISLYDNGSYDYKIKKILPCENDKTIASHIAENRLVVCLPYNDFTDLGNACFYQVFIAVKE